MRIKKIVVTTILLSVTVFSIQNLSLAKAKLNAPRVPGEPEWAGKTFLRGEEKAIKDTTPILEREYRPMHVYGNMQRRHHYRDTVIPSHQDRTDMRKAFMNRNQARNRYRS
ncbi:MAG: hypothetical protein SGI77_00370 [Pirellulaceae bacterium]|nr:hypothetical protein [Pirellulaceae bacterium]